MIETLKRLGLPENAASWDGWMSSTGKNSFILKETYERKFNVQSKKWIQTLVSTEFIPTSVPSSHPAIFHGLNYLCDQVNAFGLTQVNENQYSIGPMSATITVGPYAGKTYWYMGKTITKTGDTVKREYTSIYMNAEKDGNPSEGIVNVTVNEVVNFVSSKGTRLSSSSYNKVREFRKGQLEALTGKTSEELAAYCYEIFTLTPKNNDIYLTSISTELEKIEENVYWPNVYLNSKDDNLFNFRALIPHWATSTNDFVVRIFGYDDRTNADFPGVNYSGMGNGGKFMDLPFENETVKPVRVDFIDGNSRPENTEDELVIYFNRASVRKIIGMEIEFKPLTGKGNWCRSYVDINTGEFFLSERNF